MSSIDLDKTAQALVTNGTKPWTLGFSYCRALQDEALKAWHEKSEDFVADKRAFYHRARCASEATRARYSPSMESELVAV